jgi:alginate O-acetyltransferase complex protein AlgI
MLLGGLWHGAGWTFVFWGGLHGLYLSINHGWKKLNFPLPKALAWFITFLAIMMAWVLFRAYTLNDAAEMIKSILGIKGIILPGTAQGKLSFFTQLGVQMKPLGQMEYLPSINKNKLWSILTLFILTLGVTFLPNSQQIVRTFQPNWKWAIGFGILASICLLSLNRVSEFLYFQF